MNTTLRPFNVSRILVALGLIAISFSATRLAFSDDFPYDPVEMNRKCEVGNGALSCPYTLSLHDALPI